MDKAQEATTLTTDGPVESTPENRKLVRRAWWVAGGAALLSVASFWIDKNVMAAVTLEALPGDVAKAIMLSEAFAHAFGVAAILLTVWLLDPAAQQRLPLLLATTIGSGLPVHLLKRTVARLRPSAWDFEGPIGNTFLGWFPWRERGWGAIGDAAIQSFPSAHTALAVSLAWGLACCYPRGRWLFATLAILASVQRIVVHAHYPSDVAAGAAIGTLTFALCADPRCLGRWLLPASR